MATLTNIENVIIENPSIATHPKLADFVAEYQAALDAGADPDPATLTDMFVALIEIAVEDPEISTSIIELNAAIVEEVVTRDESLETNEAIVEMLTFYTEVVTDGTYVPPEETLEGFLSALDGVSTADPALQDAISSVTQALAPATFGVVLKGFGSPDQSGYSVSAAGDVNGDGIDDILIGAHFASPDGTSFAGATYLVFGGQSLGAELDLETLGQEGAVDGLVLNGAELFDESGKSVSSAGDVNGDGIDDILIGAPFATKPDEAGVTYLVYGGQSFGAEIDLATLGQAGGANGFVLSGIDAQDFSGYSVSTAGDVNGDGYDDILIGAIRGDPDGVSLAGETYLIYGGQSLGGDVDLATLGQAGGVDGFVLKGINVQDFSGWSVSTAGDVNGDGFDDILIGAFSASPGGETYLVYGGQSFGAEVDLATQAFVFKGIGGGGYSVSSAGDVNGDGIDDILIGAPFASPDGAFSAGETYLVYGGQSFGGVVDLTTLGQAGGADGFVVKGTDAFDESGYSVSTAGDVNGDGFDDILIGAHFASPDGAFSAGETYLVFGGQSLGGDVDLATLGQAGGVDGFVLKGIEASDESGHSVSTAGDVNGDGFDDILIGAYFASPDGAFSAGETYLVYGGSDVFERADIADGVNDGEISLANLGLNPDEFDLIV